MTDYLTCGQCLREFPLHNINLFIQHKKLGCDDETGAEIQNAELQCSSCLQGFVSSWALLVHAQLTHNLKIFLQRASQSLLGKSSPLKHKLELSTLKQGTLPLQSGNVTVQVHSSGKAGAFTTTGISQSELPAVYDRNVAEASVQGKHDNQTLESHSVKRKSDNVLVTVSSFPGTVSTQIVPTTKQFYVVPPGRVRSNLLGCNIVIQKDVISNSKVISMNGNDAAVGLLPFPQQRRVNIGSQPMVIPYIQRNSSSNEISIDVHASSSIIQTNATSDSLTCVSSVPGLISSTTTCQTSLMGEQYGSKETRVPVKVNNSQYLGVRHEAFPSSQEASVSSKDVDETAANVDSQFGNLPVTNFNSEHTSDRGVPSVSQQLIVSGNQMKANETCGGHKETDCIGKKTCSVTGASDPNPLLDDSNKATVQEGAACLDVGEADVDSEMKECDNQGCGVTVIPGSHQNLQKCCNAVIPKKRKRHMEMKHMPFSWSSSKYAKRKMFRFSSTGTSKSSSSPYMSMGTSKSNSSAFSSKTTGGTIFIDVGSDSFQSEDSPMGTSQNQTNTPTVTISREYVHSSSPNSSNPEFTATKSATGGSEGSSRSLILQPGAVFSIPFSYNIPASATIVQTTSPCFVAEKLTQAQISLAEMKPCDVNGTNPIDVSTHSSTVSSIADNNPVYSDDVQQINSSEEGFSQTFAVGSQMMVEGGEFRRRKYPTSRPFQCDKCSMAFNQRIHLKKHMSKHTGVKPYKCGECDYSTVERSHLKVHIRIHTGEKPFKCTFCEYATAQNSTLKIHLKRHHGGKMFECLNCDKKFTQEEQLKGHEWEHGPLAVISPNKDSTASNKESLADIEDSSDRTVDQEPTSVVGQEPTSAVGQEPTSAVGQEPTSAVGQEPTSAVGHEPTSVVGQEPTSVVGQEPVVDSAQKPDSTVNQNSESDGTQEPTTTVRQEPALDDSREPTPASSQEAGPHDDEELRTAFDSQEAAGVIVEEIDQDIDGPLVIDEINL